MDKIDKTLRPDNYYLETYLAVKAISGGSLNKIGKRVALACNIDHWAIMESGKNDEGYKLEESFNKKIARSLNSLVTDNKIFKKFTDLEGNELEEDEISERGLTGAQFRAFFYSSPGQGQIDGEGYLTRAGVIVHPFNAHIKYNADFMKKDNPEPEGRCRLLFVNDYHWAVSLEIDHNELPAKFIFAHKRENVQDIIDKVKNFASQKDISLKRAALVMLENTSYDFKDLEQGYVELDFNSSGEIIITNHTGKPFSIKSEGLYYDITKIDQKKDDLRMSGVPESLILKRLYEDGFLKSDHVFLLQENCVSENIAPFSPIEIEFLRYVIEVSDGVRGRP